MKLVDILARELKVWPEGNDFAWQDYDLEIRFSHNTRNDTYVSILADDHIRSRHGDDPDYGVTRAEWQAAVDALNAPKVVEWDEVGLPPVGLDVEIKRGNCTWIDGDEWQIGKTATVMASFLNSRDIEMASVQFPGGHCECILARCLSPVRTAEQVAAEERNKVIREMVAEVAEEPRARHFAFCEVLYDAGYRKEPKPCGS